MTVQVDNFKKHNRIIVIVSDSFQVAMTIYKVQDVLVNQCHNGGFYIMIRRQVSKLSIGPSLNQWWIHERGGGDTTGAKFLTMPIKHAPDCVRKLKEFVLFCEVGLNFYH